MSLFKELGTPSNEVIDSQPKTMFQELTKVVGEVRKIMKEEFHRLYPEFVDFDPVVQVGSDIRIRGDNKEKVSDFYSKLTSQLFHSSMKNTMAVCSKKLNAVVKKHTNMSIFHSLDVVSEHEWRAKNKVGGDISPEEFFETASINITTYSLNNALFYVVSSNGEEFTQEEMKVYTEAGPVYNRFLDNIRKNEDAVGKIDLKRAWVSGAFASNESIVRIGPMLWLSENYAKDDEIAAALIHEYGHVFTLYEYIGETMSFNHVLRGIVDVTIGDMSFKDKVTTIRNMSSVSEKTKELDAVKIAGMKSPNAVIAFVTDKYFTNIRSEWGMLEYDTNTVEGLADQFATRFGAGIANARFLMKISRLATKGKPLFTPFELTKVEICRWLRLIGHTGGMASIAQGFVWAMSTAAGLNFVALAAGAFLGLISFFNMSGSANTRSNGRVPDILINKGKYVIFFDQHDHAVSRFKRIKEDLIAQLKSSNLNKEMQETLLRDINEIDQMVSGLKLTDSPFYNLFGNLFNKLERAYIRKDKQEFVVRQLEELVNNDLFVRSLELKMIADKRSQ